MAMQLKIPRKIPERNLLRRNSLKNRRKGNIRTNQEYLGRNSFIGLLYSKWLTNTYFTQVNPLAQTLWGMKGWFHALNNLFRLSLLSNRSCSQLLSSSLLNTTSSIQLSFLFLSVPSEFSLSIIAIIIVTIRVLLFPPRGVYLDLDKSSGGHL